MSTPSGAGPQALVPAVFVRGGTSKGLVFTASDLPTDPKTRDAVLLAGLGSPDPYGRQLDGMGGGLSSLSKAAIVGSPTRPDADVDYTFAQVAVDAPVVDYGANCGNLSSAIGPYAVDEGLSPRPDGQAEVVVHNTNTRKLIRSSFEVRDGRAVSDGDLAVPGVPGTGAPVRLDFLDPAGSRTSGLLPGAGARQTLDVPGVGPVEVSLVDATNPMVLVSADELGVDLTLGPDGLEAVPGLMAVLDAVRRVGGVAMGLASSPDEVPLSVPKIAVVGPPAAAQTLDGADVAADGHDLTVRMVSMGRLHRAVTVTGALCLGVAAQVPGTVVADLVGGPRLGESELRIACPSGVVLVGAVMRNGDDDEVVAESAALLRTTRRLMQGHVAIPHRVLTGDVVGSPL